MFKFINRLFDKTTKVENPWIDNPITNQLSKMFDEGAREVVVGTYVGKLARVNINGFGSIVGIARFDEDCNMTMFSMFKYEGARIEAETKCFRKDQLDDITVECNGSNIYSVESNKLMYDAVNIPTSVPGILLVGDICVEKNSDIGEHHVSYTIWLRDHTHISWTKALIVTYSVRSFIVLDILQNDPYQIKMVINSIIPAAKGYDISGSFDADTIIGSRKVVNWTVQYLTNIYETDSEYLMSNMKYLIDKIVERWR